MSSYGFNDEFEPFEADDPDLTEGSDLFNFLSGDSADTTVAACGDPKRLFSDPNQIEQSISNEAVPQYSSLSYRGSTSSSSSQRSLGSTSPKTSPTSVDALMMDAPLELSMVGNGIVGNDPSPFRFDENEMFDFTGASLSPSPQLHSSPQDLCMTGNTLTRPCVSKRSTGSRKGKSKQAKQPTKGIQTNGSREVSPASNLADNHGFSKSTIIRKSTSNVDDASLNVAPNPEPWRNTASVQANGPHSMSNLFAFTHTAHGLPTYNPQISQSQTFRPRLVVQSTPTKSRVETQIPIKLTLHHLPLGIKRLHIPAHTISKPKNLAKSATVRFPDMLELSTMLVCTSAMQNQDKRERAFKRAAASHPDQRDLGQLGESNEDEDTSPQNGGEVRICGGCVTRERKRANRKKHVKPEEEELWSRYERLRVIVFNTSEIKEWQAVTPHMVDPTGAGIHNYKVSDDTVQVDVPMRIACYCRHHNEKMGFQVIFTIKDFQDNLIAQQISSTIMITDDHKTNVPTPPQQPHITNTILLSQAPPPNRVVEPKPIEAQLPFRQTQSTSDLQSLRQNGVFPIMPGPAANGSQGTSVTVTPHSLSRQGSPIDASGPVAKKRKSSGSAKVPTGLAMTKLETNQPMVMPTNLPNESAVMSATGSPFSPNIPNFSLAANQAFSHGQQQQPAQHMAQSFAQTSPTPESNKTEPFIYPLHSRNLSLDTLPVSQLYSAPTSAHPSRAPSPNHLRNEFNNLSHSQLSQGLYNSSLRLATNIPVPFQPIIYKIIPGEGPKAGGVEVTVLGKDFTNGGLEVYFGDQRAATTTYWGETSLVCLLPPSPTAGLVPVSIRHANQASPNPFSGKQQPLFKYIDDDEHRLLRMAFAVLGNKIGAPIADAADIARNMLYGRGNNCPSWGPSASGPGGQVNGGTFNSRDNDSKESVETGLLRVLEMIDLDDSANKARINLRRSSGQTMLHLACSLGFVRFVAGLLSRGANVGIRDKGGFTALHMAAMNDHPEIVRRLIMKGADPTMRTLSGLTPADVAFSHDVLRVLRRIESHSRSRSGGSLHSRASSANSLQSLWDHPTLTRAHRAEFMSDETDSTIEDVSNDSSEDIDSEGENQQWLDMRRPSFPKTPRQSDTAAGEAPVTPGAAMTALRDQVTTQIQQFQHAMAMHFHNLPQFQIPNMPQMPALPVMPMLPDYQAYIHSAPMMQRISSLVPNIRGQRPGSSGDRSARDTDNKWWEIPFFGAKDSPPPAYEDIFPQKDIDTKQSSAAQAAAEFEADKKCAALYDQTQSESSVHPEAVPALLQIGRKHQITKEQQEHLQRAHAQRLKAGSSDKMLWFVWIPILIFVLGAMIFHGAPSVISSIAGTFRFVAGVAANPREVGQRFRRLVREIA